MKLALLGAATMAVAIAVGGTASASGTSGTFSRKIKKFKVDGYPATTLCGPAIRTSASRSPPSPGTRSSPA